ncbi:MAG: hypothetical protein KGI11_10125, partial [Thaumarchaeota archaeon]|nr:hypothetical protein [Nitrososphaerota archaeon]
MPNEPTTPEFTDNFAVIPPSQNMGWKNPDGNLIDRGLPVGDDIIITNKEAGSEYMFYGFLEDVKGNLISISWDGFNTGLPKNGMLVIHTKKGITVQSPSGPIEQDVNLPAGGYKL